MYFVCNAIDRGVLIPLFIGLHRVFSVFKDTIRALSGGCIYSLITTVYRLQDDRQEGRHNRIQAGATGCRMQAIAGRQLIAAGRQAGRQP